jgi:hypothetical protein
MLAEKRFRQGLYYSLSIMSARSVEPAGSVSNDGFALPFGYTNAVV